MSIRKVYCSENHTSAQPNQMMCFVNSTKKVFINIADKHNIASIEITLEEAEILIKDLENEIFNAKMIE